MVKIMNDIQFKASLILQSNADQDCIREVAMACFLQSLVTNQINILQGVAMASPCKCPDGRDGLIVFELIRLGLIHKTTLAGKSNYFAATELGLEVIEKLNDL